MRPFDLEKALAGEPVVTRDGKKVTEIFLLKTVTARQNNLLAVVDGDWYLFFRNGALEPGLSCNGDLFMAPVKHQEWGYLWKYREGGTAYNFSYKFPDEESAIKHIELYPHLELVKTVLIREWEE